MSDFVYDVILSKNDDGSLPHLVFTSIWRLSDYLESLPVGSCIHIYKVQNFIDLDFSRHETDPDTSFPVGY